MDIPSYTRRQGLGFQGFLYLDVEVGPGLICKARPRGGHLVPVADNDRFRRKKEKMD